MKALALVTIGLYATLFLVMNAKRENQSVSKGSSGFDQIVEATPIEAPSSVGGMGIALEEPRAKRSM